MYSNRPQNKRKYVNENEKSNHKFACKFAWFVNSKLFLNMIAVLNIEGELFFNRALGISTD